MTDNSNSHETLCKIEERTLHLIVLVVLYFKLQIDLLLALLTTQRRIRQFIAILISRLSMFPIESISILRHFVFFILTFWQSSSASQLTLLASARKRSVEIICHFIVTALNNNWILISIHSLWICCLRFCFCYCLTSERTWPELRTHQRSLQLRFSSFKYFVIQSYKNGFRPCPGISSRQRLPLQETPNNSTLQVSAVWAHRVPDSLFTRKYLTRGSPVDVVAFTCLSRHWFLLSGFFLLQHGPRKNDARPISLCCMFVLASGLWLS